MKLNERLSLRLKRYLTIIVLAMSWVFASEIQTLHFLIPGGKGGGWDSTARAVGDVLKQSKLLQSVSYENISGGGGEKAISYLIDTAYKQNDTLMVHSTPIVIHALQKVFPQSFRDLTLVASVITDFQVLVVKKTHVKKSWSDIVDDFRADPQSFKVGGGSNRGSMDHLVCAKIFQAAGFDPKDLRYSAYDAGGEALNALLGGEVDLLSTGLGEVLEYHKKGFVQIIAITSEKSIENALDIPTFQSLGVDVVFANWRGFFAAPGTKKKRVKKLADLLQKMYQTDQWKEIKKKNGWSDLYLRQEDFKNFLEQQEESLDSLMRELGFM